MLEAKGFRKARIPKALQIQNPSPANIQSTRLALHLSPDRTTCNTFIASGRHVYQLKILLGDSLICKGKDNLLIPENTQLLDSFLIDRCSHRSEIQSIAVSEFEGTGNFILGSVDSYGHLVVSKLDSSCNDVDSLTYSVFARDSSIGEGSWAGLCFCPSQWSTVAVAHSFRRSIDVYDQDLHLRTLCTLWYPTSLTFLQNFVHGNVSSILALTEGCQLSIWDLRMKENGGCIQRISGSLGDIYYAVCSSSTGNISVGGADRNVTIYDPRRWSSLSKWMHCSKYEITGLAFSSFDPSHVYIQGVDYEVICGDWKQRSKLFSFRGDSNWLGFSKCSNSDVLGGWCDSGSIFVADVVYQ